MVVTQNFKEELVGVFGHPVAENPTVVMQQAAFQELNIKWRYLTIDVFPEDLEAAIHGMRAMNMRGINLTIPHKVEVLKYLDEVKAEAALMGAVNTVVRKGDQLIGENTDGKGFMWSLTKEEKIDPKGKTVVIFGAGGAARSITVELALAGVNKITIVNRSEARGTELRNLLVQKTNIQSNFIQWEKNYTISSENDIVINATSIGLLPNIHDKPDIDYLSIQSNMIVCDVIPAPTTSFLNEAKHRGAKTIDGLGMLVYQGAIGFKLWTGLDAPVPVMKKALEEVFAMQ
jgi:shikimate dehydrogenase